jgi:hypothetical protein
VSAAGSARLALVPSAAEVHPPPPPFDAMVRSAAAKRATLARGRRVLSATWVCGCALLVVGPLLAPFTDGLSLAGMVLAGALLLPTSGLALAGLGVYERSREAVFALVMTALTLASAVALIGPAHRAAIEMYVAAHGPELEGVAAEIRTAFAAAPYDPDPVRGTTVQMGRRFGPQLRRLSIQAAVPVDGGLLFNGRGEMGYTLLYADGAGGPPDSCRDRRMRFIGGRWFEAECRDRGDD